MLLRTHLIVALGVIFLFLPYIENKIIFIPALLIASLIPDIDTSFSSIGKRKIFRLFQFFTKHRGILHSFTFCIFIAIIFAASIPVLALPWFLGYGSHLLFDSFTIEGIKPFWPLKKTIYGKIKTGGHAENIILFLTILINILLILKLFD